MPEIKFKFANGTEMTAEAAAGARLMDIARTAGIPVDAPCSGNGLCGKCRMQLISGEMESKKSRHISDNEYADGWRLSCETYITGDAEVAVPQSASAFKLEIRTADLSEPKVRRAFDDVRAKLVPDNAIKKYTLSLDAPAPDDTRADNERLCDALEAMLGRRPVLSLHALRRLAGILRENDFRLTAVVCENDNSLRIMDVFAPDEDKHCLGLAVDIGTTTVSAVLVDLKDGEPLAQMSAGNGQIPYGADVINRIIESSRGGKEKLRKAIVDDTLIPLIDEICLESGECKENIYRVEIAGNTTMEHLLLALDADPIRMDPYVPGFFCLSTLRAADVIPGLNPEALLHLAPNVGSYVGGDITAGVYASHLWDTDKTTLFIDLGTNGEMVIGNREYMMCCACSAGPAFEGGDISCGMRATNGAVEEVSIDPDTTEPHLTIIGEPDEKPRGLCGSGIIDMVASLFKCGIISPKGKFVKQCRRVQFDEHGMGRYVFAFPEESADGRELSLNEVDIDNLMRAKGAIFSAIRLLLGQLGLAVEDVEEILIAGGIGGGIDFENAVTIGMLPDVPRERFKYIGNTSLSGAYAALISMEASEKIDGFVGSMMYVELSNEPGYMDEFVAACFFPHTDRSLFPSV